MDKFDERRIHPFEKIKMYCIKVPESLHKMLKDVGADEVRNMMGHWNEVMYLTGRWKKPRYRNPYEIRCEGDPRWPTQDKTKG